MEEDLVVYETIVESKLDELDFKELCHQVMNKESRRIEFLN